MLMHGSGGLAPNVEMWTRVLNSRGISTFALDSLTGRGLVDLNPDQSRLGRLNFILDIYRSLEILARHPRVDPDRIVVMGFSRGGQAALYASVRRFQSLWNKSGIDLAAYLAFYPDCMTTYRGDGDVAPRPIRVFGGAMDDYNPLSACRAYAQRLREAGRDIDAFQYPNGTHAFENPLGARPPVARPTFQSVRDCKIEERDGGVLLNLQTGKPFAYSDQCVRLGPHLGFDGEATDAATAELTRFLGAVLTKH